MEKTLTIDGKKVRFKSTGATPLRYKAQFQKDFFADILKLNSLKGLQKAEEIKSEDIEKIDFDVLYNITWVLAKTADKEIAEPIEWLDAFSEFPLLEIVPELQDLIQSTIQAKKKQKTKGATVKK
jgi:hypothetical protein